MLLLSLYFSTLPVIRTFWCCVLSKAASSTIFKVFDMTQPVIEPKISWAIDELSDHYASVK